MTGELEIRPSMAVKAMRARGIDNAEDLLQHASPEAILKACKHWDARKGVGTGLLVKWIREGGVPEQKVPERESRTKREQLLAVFDEYANQLERDDEGDVRPRQKAASHAAIQHLRGDLKNDNRCDGNMIVLTANYPVIEMRCDRCGFIAGTPVSLLHALRPPERL